MDANEIERIISGLINFGGIFELHQLKNIKILSYPVSLIINLDAHWISVFISETKLEIMDSLGYFQNENIDKILCELLALHIKHKNFTISPLLQKPNSDTCAKFAICFLFYKTLTANSLCKFCANFSSDLNSNDDIINEIFETVLKIE